MKNTASVAIELYRRHISRHKGFSCAYRIILGESSCSEYGLRCTEKYGNIDSAKLIYRRLLACRQVHQEWLVSQNKDKDDKNKNDSIWCLNCVPFDSGVLELCACIP